MADLNEPKKETDRVDGSPHPNHRPPASVEKEMPPLNPLTPRSGPTAETKPSLATLRPAPAPVRPPAVGLKVTPSPSPIAPLTSTPGTSKPGFSSIGRPLENRGPVHSGSPKESPRVADVPIKAAVQPGNIQSALPHSPVIRSTPLPVAHSPLKGLGALAPARLCWALLGLSLLSLVIQLWNYFS